MLGVARAFIGMACWCSLALAAIQGPGCRRLGPSVAASGGAPAVFCYLFLFRFRLTLYDSCRCPAFAAPCFVRASAGIAPRIRLLNPCIATPLFTKLSLSGSTPVASCTRVAFLVSLFVPYHGRPGSPPREFIGRSWRLRAQVRDA